MQQKLTAPNVDTAAYTDLNRLSQLKVGNRDSEANVRKVAQEFESLFLNQMLKSMRAATDVLADKNSPTHSQAAQQYRDLHDQQLSITLARQGKGLGLADYLSNQLAQRGAHKTLGTASSSATGAGAIRDDSKFLAMRRLSLPAPSAAPTTATAMASAAYSSAAQIAGYLTTPSAVGRSARLDRAGAPLNGTRPLPATLDDSSVEAVGKGLFGTSEAQFQSQEEFIATLLPMAEKAAQQLGIEPHFLVAQAALETGWGRSMIRTAAGENSHNLFGVKANNWQGSATAALTTEYVDSAPIKEVANFRVYDSFEQSFNDYAMLLQGNQRYRAALQAAVQDRQGSEQFVKELQKAGYATDPNYAKKVIQIAKKVQQTHQNMAETDNFGLPIHTRG